MLTASKIHPSQLFNTLPVSIPFISLQYIEPTLSANSLFISGRDNFD